MTTRIIDAGAAPVQVNPAGHELGEPGRSLRLTNAGNNPLYWWIGDRVPDGVPGFPIARGESHEITLPSLPLWAWTQGTSRLLATPLGGADHIGVVPGASAAVPLGQSPVAAMAPTGVEPGGLMLAVAAGERIYAVAGSAGAPPDPLVAETTLSLGESTALSGAENDAPSRVWWWTDRYAGATLLLTAADGLWDI